jgi:hypothetical protein
MARSSTTTKAPSGKRYWLHWLGASDDDLGIFLPYNSQEEAERQAAWEIANGGERDQLGGVYVAPYDVPRLGWSRRQLDDNGFTPRHLIPGERERVATAKQVLSRANRHAQDILDEAERGQADYLLGMNAAIKDGSAFKAAVPGNAYTWNTGGTATGTACALAAGTAKTVILVVSAAANQPAIVEIGVSFDGVTATAVPVLVELTTGTAATAGTPRAALAAGKQVRGWPAQTSQTTVADSYSAEPTVELVNRKWLVTPNGGLFVMQFPLGREPTGIVTSATDAKTWGIRCTAPATVNCHAYVEFEE